MSLLVLCYQSQRIKVIVPCAMILKFTFLFQHLHQESNSRGVIVSYIAKQQNLARLEVWGIMAWQEELRVMNNG